MSTAPPFRFARPVFKTKSAEPARQGSLDRITDIYFHEPIRGGGVAEGLEAGGAGAYGFAGKSTPIRFKGTEMEAWVDSVAAIVAAEFPEEEDFRIQVDGVSWRCCRDTSELSSEVSMRQIPSTLPMLSELNTDNAALISLLQHPFLNDGGLVLVSGLNGSGKTTLCGSFLKTRLERYGGRCVSVEDPKELPMEGFMGAGVVRQMEVRYGDDVDPHRRGFPGALRRAYRKFPAARPIILYVGEVRDEETAVEVLKAGSNGMLVITTEHAESCLAAIERMTALAAIRLGSGVNSMMASALRLSVHSTLEWIEGGSGEAKFKRARSHLEALFSSGPVHAAAAMIRGNQFHQLNQVLEKQSTILSQASKSGMPANAVFQQLGGKLA